MAEIGATRKGGPPQFKHRDHYNAKGEPKKPLTIQRAEEIVAAHNSELTGRERHRQPLMYYVCSQCEQIHVGHVSITRRR